MIRRLGSMLSGVLAFVCDLPRLQLQITEPPPPPPPPPFPPPPSSAEIAAHGIQPGRIYFVDRETWRKMNRGPFDDR